MHKSQETTGSPRDHLCNFRNADKKTFRKYLRILQWIIIVNVWIKKEFQDYAMKKRKCLLITKIQAWPYSFLNISTEKYLCSLIQCCHWFFTKKSQEEYLTICAPYLVIQQKRHLGNIPGSCDEDEKIFVRSLFHQSSVVTVVLWNWQSGNVNICAPYLILQTKRHLGNIRWSCNRCKKHSSVLIYKRISRQCLSSSPLSKGYVRWSLRFRLGLSAFWISPQKSICEYQHL